MMLFGAPFGNNFFAFGKTLIRKPFSFCTPQPKQIPWGA
jgi:hypothetical protein